MDAIQISFVVFQTTALWAIFRGVGMMSPKKTLPWVALWFCALVVISG